MFNKKLKQQIKELQERLEVVKAEDTGRIISKKDAFIVHKVSYSWRDVWFGIGIGTRDYLQDILYFENKPNYSKIILKTTTDNKVLSISYIKESLEIKNPKPKLKI